MRRSEGVRSPQTALVAALALLAALLVLSLIPAPRAEAYIYWTNGTSIGRSDLDRTGVNPRFIAGAGKPIRLALDAEHVYWTNGNTDAIGRANLDGTGVEESFIGAINPTGVAVDAEHVYWTWSASECEVGWPCSVQTAAGGIGRANLDGTGVDQSFIGGIHPVDYSGDSGYLAVDAEHIYWSDGFCEGEVACSGEPTERGVAAIARANLDGTGVDRSFIVTSHTAGPYPMNYPTGVYPTGLAIDAEHIYWTGVTFDPAPVGATLGRASLDGSDVDQSFIGGPCCFYAPLWSGVAVDDAHVYWTNDQRERPTRSIRRANLDGSGARDFILPEGDKDFSPGALAVDALTVIAPEGNARAARTQRQTGRRIVVKVKVQAQEELTAKATGEIKVNPTYKLRPKKVYLTRGETKRLELKPKERAWKIAKALKQGQNAKAKLTVKLRDAAGNRKTEKLRVRLKG